MVIAGAGVIGRLQEQVCVVWDRLVVNRVSLLSLRRSPSTPSSTATFRELMPTWLVCTCLCHDLTCSITSVHFCPATFPGSEAEQRNGSNTCVRPWANHGGVQTRQTEQVFPTGAPTLLHRRLQTHNWWPGRLGLGGYCQLSLPLQHR